MTQDELGLAVGISRNSVGLYERGERAPDVELLRKIAAAVCVDQFDVGNDVQIVFTQGGDKRRSSSPPQQLTLNLGDSAGITVKIEAGKVRSAIRAALA
jgi:transcriptional regulator with XRE-family HTH domain